MMVVVGMAVMMIVIVVVFIAQQRALGKLTHNPSAAIGIASWKWMATG